MGDTTAFFFGEGDGEQTTPTPTVSQPALSTELDTSLGKVSSLAPQPDFSRCDCRIQALEAIRLEALTWTLATVPDLEEWAQACAGWIVVLPTELLMQAWMVQLILVLTEHVGFTTERASTLMQLAVGRALIHQQEGWA